MLPILLQGVPLNTSIFGSEQYFSKTRETNTIILEKPSSLVEIGIPSEKSKMIFSMV